MSPALLFVVVCLAAFRLVRLVTVDDFPPMVWVRDGVESRVDHWFGPDWAGGVRCPWCAGFWLCGGVVAAVWSVAPLPLPALWFASVPSVVGVASTAVEALDS